MKQLTFVYFFLICSGSVFAQQNAHFSQYVFNGIHINPAYAGYKQQMYLQHYYSAQWAGVTGAPKSLSVAMDGNFKDNKVGLGVLLTHDEIGAQAHTAGYLNYAYRVKTGKDESSVLALGLGAGIIRSALDGNLLRPVEPGDLYIPETGQSAFSPDIRAGVYFSNEEFFAGFSAEHLLPVFLERIKGNGALIPLPRPHFYLTAGTIVPVTADVKFKPVVLLKDDHAGPTSMDLNAFLLLKERVWFGGLYRRGVKVYEKKNLDAGLSQASSAGIIMEVFATTDLRFGYAFEYSTNRLRNQSAGSHEVSLGITFGPRRNPGLKCYF